MLKPRSRAIIVGIGRYVLGPAQMADAILAFAGTTIGADRIGVALVHAIDRRYRARMGLRPGVHIASR